MQGNNKKLMGDDDKQYAQFQNVLHLHIYSSPKIHLLIKLPHITT